MKKTDNRIAFTKTNIENLPFEKKGVQKAYYDTNPTDLMLRVAEQSKTFYLQSKIKGKDIRVCIGKFGTYTINQAKEEVLKAKIKLNQGINPNEEKKAVKGAVKQAQVIDKQTVKWLLDEYKQKQIIEKKGGATGSIKGIDDTYKFFNERVITTLKFDEKKNEWIEDDIITLDNWLDRPLRSIGKREVLKRFDLFAKAKPLRGGKVLKPIARTHQLSFKNLSIAYNWIIPLIAGFDDEKEIKDEDLIDNPINILTTYDRWENSKERTNFLNFKKKDGYLFLKALNNYSYCDYIVRDYIMISLLQGGRSIDIAPLKWVNVDFEEKNITYKGTKNKLDYLFPMTNLVYEILKERFDKKTSEYVFEYTKSKKNGYIVQSAKYHFEMLFNESGILLSHHDLRRTITTIASNLKVGDKIAKHILKHKIQGVDKHYFMREIDELKMALQTIEDYILSQVKKFEELNNDTK